MTTITSLLDANAIIARVGFTDDFTRTSGGTFPSDYDHWGAGWALITRSTNLTTGVDGSAAYVSSNEWLIAVPDDQVGTRITYGSVQFDFWVSATADDAPYFWLRSGGAYPYGLEAYVSGGKWWVGLYYFYSSTDPYYEFTPTPGSWYRLKGYVNGMPDGLLAIKLWKVGDPEPDTFTATGRINDIATPITNLYDIRLEIDADIEQAKIDNIQFVSYGEPSDITKRFSLSAGAIVKKTMPTKTFSANATFDPMSFSADAWIIGGRSGHSRLWDHYGTQPDTVVVLDGPIGEYPSGMTVHAVLADIIDRIVALEGGMHRVGLFDVGAFIQPVVRASAVIFATLTKTKTADAVIALGKARVDISADALITETTVSVASADAYLIDLVC